MIYKISKEASNDLEKIWLYTIETWSAEQADRYLNLIFDEIEYLCQKPNSPAPARIPSRGSTI